MQLNNIISELKRRNVFKVATAYAIAGWLIIQIATSVFPAFNFPDWTTQFVIILVGIGFPISLIVAWAFELTAEGLKKTEEVDATESITPRTGKKINTIIIVTLSIAVTFLLVDKFVLRAGEVVDSGTVPVSSVSDKSIAVLPFDDFNAGGEQEYFADGLTEEILNVLAKTPDLKVASRTSSFQFKDKNSDITEVAKTLGVAHILEGSVRQSSSRIRVTAQLIRASDGFHLWSENYDEQPEDIIQVQEDIALKIAGALDTAMDPEALAEMVKSGTSSVEAYNAYLKGMTYGPGFGDSKKAYEKFEEARKLDPTYAEAHYKASTFWRQQLTTTVMAAGQTDKTYLEMMREANERLDLAIEYASPVDKLKYQSDKAVLNLQFRRAADLITEYLEKRPSDKEQTIAAINIMNILGDDEAAGKYARQLEEISLENPSDYGFVALGYFWGFDVPNAARVARKAVEKFPYESGLLYQAQRILLWDGAVEEAALLTPRITEEIVGDQNLPMVTIRQACAEGDTEKAQEIFNTEDTFDESVSIRWLGLRLLGKTEEAKELLIPIHDRNELFSLSSWMYYRYFNVYDYPKLKRVLETEGAVLRDPIEIPFACK